MHEADRCCALPWHQRRIGHRSVRGTGPTRVIRADTAQGLGIEASSSMRTMRLRSPRFDVHLRARGRPAVLDCLGPDCCKQSFGASHA